MTILGFDSNKLLSDDRSTDIIRALFPFILMVLGGIIFIFFYTLQFALHSWIIAWSVLGVATIVAGASLLFGGLLGFLFGIPRTMGNSGIQNGVQNSKNNSSANSESSNEGNPIQANTNLEDISDWLTKILVGVGLTQIGDITKAIARLIDWLAPGFSDGTPEQLIISKGFTLAVFVYFNVSGFFIGFLWARLYLPSQFRQADLGQVNKKVDKFEKEFRKDIASIIDNNKAQNITNQYLNQESGNIDNNYVDKKDLDKPIQKADRMTRDTIFNEIQEIRQENAYKREELTQNKLEKAIDILDALVRIETDEQKRYMYLREQGIVMKEKKNPDWKKAEKILSKVIESRPDLNKDDVFPEFHLAMCRIHLDDNFNKQQKTPSMKRELILDALQKAVKHNFLLVEQLKSEDSQNIYYLWNGEKQILPWLQANDITVESLQLSQSESS